MSFAVLVETLCEAMINVSWQATLLGILVMVIRFLFARWIGPEVAFLLWMVIFIRLLLVGAPESPLSLGNYTGVHILPVRSEMPEARTRMQLEADFYLIRLLSTIWAIGVLVSLSQWFKARQFWGAELRSAELVGEPEILNALADAEHDLGLEPQVTIVHSPHVSSPALYGLFKPRLVIPSSMMRILTQHQWYLIFRHEMAHVKRGDMVVMHLIALFQALHWFNPVIRHLLRMVMVDMELAADASALNGRKSSDRKLYARTLLRFVEQPEANIEKIHGRPLRVGFWEEEYEIFSRFRQLSGPVKSGLRGLIPGIALLLLLVVTGLTDPMFPRPVQPLSFDSIRVLVDW